MNENLRLPRNNFFRIYFIFLDVNGIGGSLPTEIGNMESLEVIDLGKQKIISLQYLTNYFFITVSLIYMIFFFIGVNLLTGPMPTELGKLTNATAIIFGECNGYYLVREV